MSKPAYFIIDVKIHNYEAIKPYAEKVANTYLITLDSQPEYYT